MVSVALRIRPGASQPSVTSAGPKVVRVHTDEAYKDFAFDRVYGPSATQDELSEFASDLVDRCLRGQVATMLCYGQTGSGKTHTMGLLDDFNIDSKGVVPYCLGEILRTEKMRVRLEFIEQYLDSCYDLLNAGLKLKLRDMGKHGIVVENATHVEVENFEEAAEIMALATKQRQVLEVSLDQGIISDPYAKRHLSSRAHAILSIHVEISGASNLWGRLVLVDLAGSERTTGGGTTSTMTTKTISQRLVEARHINASLSALGNVVCALAKKKKHCPWRDQKLTKLLWDSLYRGHVRVLATVHADQEFLNETMSTIMFSTRCKRLSVPLSPTLLPSMPPDVTLNDVIAQRTFDNAMNEYYGIVPGANELSFGVHGSTNVAGIDPRQPVGMDPRIVCGVTDPRQTIQSSSSGTTCAVQRVDDASSWFGSVLSTISDQCENEPLGSVVSEAPPQCAHMVPLARQCIARIKYIKHLANLRRTISDSLVSHAAAQLSGMDPKVIQAVVDAQENPYNKGNTTKKTTHVLSSDAHRKLSPFRNSLPGGKRNPSECSPRHSVNPQHTTARVRSPSKKHKKEY